MIKKVILKNFKRFREQEFIIRDNIVLAGPNNSGKTTLLQSIATWHFALDKWRREKGVSKAGKRTGVPITRNEFRTMPVRELNLLWTDTSTALKKSEGKQGTPRVMSITLEGETPGGNSWELTMEFRYSNSELVYAKPSEEQIPSQISDLIVHVPSFSGISADEPIHAPDYQEWLIGQGKPGDILRNLLMQVHSDSTEQWEKLNNQIKDIFGYRLLPPEYEGRPFIVCDYLPGIPPKRGYGGLPKLDIANAGSGFLQTLMLFAFFHARPATVFLMDEPDAHLHVVLQEQIYRRLIGLAEKNHSQLIIATHSEVLVDDTPPEKILSFYGDPHALLKKTDRDEVREALKRLSAMDITRSEAKRVLYVENESDFRILCAWARILSHPILEWIEGENVYYYPMRGRNPREAKAHFFALRAIHAGMKGLILIDGDDKETPERDIKTNGLEIFKWERYEIENYLLHPESIGRFVEPILGPLFSDIAVKAMKNMLPPAVMSDPLANHDYLERTPASKELLPRILEGLDVPKAEYYRIAEAMKPEELHDDIGKFFDSLASQLLVRNTTHG